MPYWDLVVYFNDGRKKQEKIEAIGEVKQRIEQIMKSGGREWEVRKDIGGGIREIKPKTIN
jgi:hypothetical protein